MHRLDLYIYDYFKYVSDIFSNTPLYMPTPNLGSNTQISARWLVVNIRISGRKNHEYVSFLLAIYTGARTTIRILHRSMDACHILALTVSTVFFLW